MTVRETARPCIFTLSKSELRPAEHHPLDTDIGWLPWKELAAAIEQSPEADNRRADLLTVHGRGRPGVAIIADFWQRSSLKHAALALEVPLREYATYEDATSWFAAALNELESKGILTGFLDAMAARARTNGSDPNLLGS